MTDAFRDDALWRNRINLSGSLMERMPRRDIVVYLSLALRYLSRRDIYLLTETILPGRLRLKFMSEHAAPLTDRKEALLWAAV